MRATAAPAHWPYLDHRTLAEVYEAERDAQYEIAALDQLSRQRALSDRESRRLETLIRRAA